MRYLITFACYGTRLHGDTTGPVDRHRNQVRSPVLDPDRERLAAEFRQMTQAPYSLDATGREAVLAAIKEVCLYRRWTLLAAHIRTTHVHLVVGADARPEKVMNDLKAYATRALHRLEPDRKHWARHGSTRWLWKDDEVRRAIQYVVEEQGEPMAVYVSTDF